MDPVTMTQEEYEARTAEEPYARTRTQGSQSADPEQFPLAAALMPKLLNRSFILRWDNGSAVPLDDGFEIFVESFIAGLAGRARH